MGNRWEGTLNYGANSPGNVLTPICPNQKQCSCAGANADPGKYPDAYKLFLKTFAIGMFCFCFCFCFVCFFAHFSHYFFLPIPFLTRPPIPIPPFPRPHTRTHANTSSSPFSK